MAGITGSLCERGSEVQRMSRASPDVRLCCPLVVTGSIKYYGSKIGSRTREVGGGESEAAAQMQALCTPPSQLLLPLSPPTPQTFFRFPLFVNQKWKNTQTFHIRVCPEQGPGAKA